MKKINIEVAFRLKIFVLNLVIDFAFKLTLETLIINLKLKKFCTKCVANKSTKMVKQQKCIIFTSKKFKKIYANFYKPYNLLLKSSNTYIKIFICKKTRKA